MALDAANAARIDEKAIAGAGAVPLSSKDSAICSAAIAPPGLESRSRLRRPTMASC